jgi:hypothetical protein
VSWAAHGFAWRVAAGVPTLADRERLDAGEEPGEDEAPERLRHADMEARREALLSPASRERGREENGQAESAVAFRVHEGLDVAFIAFIVS